MQTHCTIDIYILFLGYFSFKEEHFFVNKKIVIRIVYTLSVDRLKEKYILALGVDNAYESK
jgi:hypothetical protein